MQYLAVLFSGADPTKGAYNQLPLFVAEIDDPSQLPKDGQVWVLMTYPALSEYIERVRIKNEPYNAGMNPYDVAAERVQRCKEFGLSLIDQAAAENISLGLNTAQVMDMLSKFSTVIPMLMTGSLSSALLVLENTKGDALVPQSRIDGYVQQIKEFIGTLP